MKTTVIIFLLVILITIADAGILLKLKNGNTMEWSNLSEEADQYCTKKSSGKFCIPKNTVVSVSQEYEDPGAVVIVNKTSDAEKEESRNEFLGGRKKQECEEMWAKIESTGSEAIKKGSFTKTAEAMSLRRKYNAKCQTPEQNKAYNQRMDKTFNNINQQNKQFQQYQITDSTEKSTKDISGGCSSDFSCGRGYKCVKAPHEIDGVCMKSVDEYGIQKYDSPRSGSSGIKSKGDCTFNSDCPIGFHCDAKYKACVK